jgi:hypothetical protein
MIFFFAKELYYIPWLLKRIHLYRSKVCTSQAEDSDPSPQLCIHLPARTRMTCKQKKLLSAAPPHHALLKFLEKKNSNTGCILNADQLIPFWWAANYDRTKDHCTVIQVSGNQIQHNSAGRSRWSRVQRKRFLLSAVTLSAVTSTLVSLPKRSTIPCVHVYISAWRQARFVSSAFWQ